MNDEERLRLMAENARSYANALRDTRPLAKASQAHIDQMLTWAIGLMGAGLFAFQTALKTACGVEGPDLRAATWLGAPWIAGITSALVGRIIGAWHRDADDFAFVAKWQAVETMLLRGLTVEEMGTRLLAIMNDKDETLKKLVRRARCWGKATDWCYYLAHGALGLGVLLVSWKAFVC